MAGAASSQMSISLGPACPSDSVLLSCSRAVSSQRSASRLQATAKRPSEVMAATACAQEASGHTHASQSSVYEMLEPGHIAGRCLCQGVAASGNIQMHMHSSSTSGRAYTAAIARTKVLAYNSNTWLA